MEEDENDHLELMHAVYIDACMKCPAAVSDLRDLDYIKSRVKNEGLSFLTITLPNFAKDFERSLANGLIDSTCFRSFRKYGAIPAFLRGMLSHIFDKETGRLYEEFPYTSILVEAVRQICLLYKKIELPCTPERERAAVENFVQVERDFSSSAPSSTDAARFVAVSDALWHNMLGSFDPNVLVPRHGPGATAERISGNQKYTLKFWHDRLERVFPIMENGFSISSYGSDDFKRVTAVPWDKEPPVRVTLVPKTLKSPRIIAIEPVCMQYAQQAIQSYLYDKIESYWLTRRHVNFTDQRVNQKMALRSSRTGRYATIDLSDASDRVPVDLALRMFDCCPDLLDVIRACRSYRAELPDGRIISPLNKFASMGSALCFPIEAMYFYTICVIASLDYSNLPLTPRNLFKVTRRIYVYGDDIIVPTDQAETILDYLRKYNCKVNNAKTFFTGKFRESCGVDAYDGHEVTPTYVRSLRPKNRQQAAELISYVATANLFYKKGYWRAASLMFCTCERILGPLPYVSERSPALGRVSFMGYRTLDRWDDSTHSFKTKGWVSRQIYRSDQIDGYPALQKCLLSLERRSASNEDASETSVYHRLRHLEPDEVDGKHLARSARRGAFALKHRWVPST